jgi:hypothetical protein
LITPYLRVEVADWISQPKKNRQTYGYAGGEKICFRFGQGLLNALTILIVKDTVPVITLLGGFFTRGSTRGDHQGGQTEDQEKNAEYLHWINELGATMKMVPVFELKIGI